MSETIVKQWPSKDLTLQARAAFMDGVARIPGVLGVEPRERVIVVLVPSLLGEAAKRVYDLEAEVGSRFPGARLEVWVRETG
jgi:hypothetical protein